LNWAGAQGMCVDSEIQLKTYIRVPSRKTIGRNQRIVRALLGSFLSPFYWLLSYLYGVPGLAFRLRCARLAGRLLLKRRSTIAMAEIYRLLFWPLDSVRYFEFDFAWKSMSNLAARNYLDVSSPRLFPILFTLQQKQLQAEFINPDVTDLGSTRNISTALDLGSRCEIRQCMIEAAPFPSGTFDIVTSISVVEHIPNDRDAIQKMWDLVKPGGRLVLTVPCASQAREEYIDRDEYGLLQPGEGGYFFFQRYYDQKLLAESVFSVTGRPCRCAIYGEKSAGSYDRNQRSKRLDPEYPLWREPYMMGQEYRYFKTIEELPGVGVAGMEFIKA
jgi:SAM-dependent methyltransferase